MGLSATGSEAMESKAKETENMWAEVLRAETMGPEAVEWWAQDQIPQEWRTWDRRLRGWRPRELRLWYVYSKFHVLQYDQLSFKRLRYVTKSYTIIPGGILQATLSKNTGAYSMLSLFPPPNPIRCINKLTFWLACLQHNFSCTEMFRQWFVANGENIPGRLLLYEKMRWVGFFQKPQMNSMNS